MLEPLGERDIESLNGRFLDNKSDLPLIHVKISIR